MQWEGGEISTRRGWRLIRQGSTWKIRVSRYRGTQGRTVKASRVIHEIVFRAPALLCIRSAVAGSDEPEVDAILSRVMKDRGQFTTVVRGIVQSDSFRCEGKPRRDQRLEAQGENRKEIRDDQ